MKKIGPGPLGALQAEFIIKQLKKKAKQNSPSIRKISEEDVIKRVGASKAAEMKKQTQGEIEKMFKKKPDIKMGGGYMRRLTPDEEKEYKETGKLKSEAEKLAEKSGIKWK